MALSLGAEIGAAQELQYRHPLCEIISMQLLDDIPFDGTRLTAGTDDEFGPTMIAHSTGRLCMAYICEEADVAGQSQIKYVYTDTDRMVFNTVVFDMGLKSTNDILSLSICEIPGGNIGILYLKNNVGTSEYQIHYKTITVEGVAIATGQISHWLNSVYTSEIHGYAASTQDFTLVYAKASAPNYYFYKRTSSNFTTWSTVSQISIAGLTTTLKLKDPYLMKTQAGTAGDIWFWFTVVESLGPNDEELTNIYSSHSHNSGSTWATASKFTSYTEFSEVAAHPVSYHKTATQVYLLFTKIVSVLHMDESATGWPTGDVVSGLSWDSTNRKLYAHVVNWGGWNHLDCIVEIDTDTWTATDYWDSTTAPAAFPAELCAGGNMEGMPFVVKTEGHIIPVMFGRSGVCVLDADADSITNYFYKAVYGYAQNLELPASTFGDGSWEPTGCQYDSNTGYLWMCFASAGVNGGILVGYIDLADGGTGDPLMYTWNTVIHDVSAWSQAACMGLRSQNEDSSSGHGGFLVVADEDIIIVSGAPDSAYTSSPSQLIVYSISEAAELHRLNNSENADFPRWGIQRHFHYEDNKIYGAFEYYATQSDYRGICIVDLTTETCSYSRPTWDDGVDDYQLKHMVRGPDQLLIVATYGYGITTFDIQSLTWELYSNDNIPNFTEDGEEKFYPVAWDETNEFIMAGECYSSTGWAGVIMFSIYGSIRQTQYQVANWTGAAWTWSTADNVVQGFQDYEMVGVADPDDNTAMWCFWTNENWDGDKRIKWDRDGTELDLANFITEEVITEHSIEGVPAKLNFSVSHGHLFDPYNLGSTFNIYLKKGRKLTLRWGEKISGVDYWQNAGTFFVSGSTIEFKRGDYPVMRVEAADRRSLWEHHQVYATDYYNSLMPDEIISDIIKEHGGLEDADINLPTFDDETILEHQWLDTTIDDICNAVCNRFGYYPRMNVSGVYTARKIANDNDVDHTYSDSAKLLRYSPDDKYSDFTNRVTVQGQSRDYEEVLFAEESVARLNGTVGWWGYRKDFQVWYSEDHSRQCRYPRLEVIETATSIGFRLAGSISESITGSATDELSCTVTVSAPNLIPLLIAGLAIYTAGAVVSDGVIAGGCGAVSGVTISIGRIIEKVGLFIVVMVLAATGNFQYQIHAQPVGTVRRSLQASWDDEDHQAEIDAIVEQVLQDPLCYSVADCYKVAAFEGMVVQMQRRRLKFEKITHLQDEEGDTIRIAHPYSGEFMDFFITNLVRRFKKAGPNSDDGYFIDEMEGWLCS